MQRLGLTPARLAAMVVAVFALLPAACGGDDKNESATNATAQATARATPEPATLAQQAAERTEALNSFHFVLEHEKGYTPIQLGLQMTKAEGDYAKPEKLQADLEARSTQFGNTVVKVKVVSVGEQAKISNPFSPSQFIPLPGAQSLADIFDPGAGTTAALRAVKNPRITGEETVDGVKVWRLEGDVEATALEAFASLAEPGYTVKGVAWIGQETPNVHRIRMEGQLGPTDPEGVIRVVRLSKFNDPVSINLP